MHYRQIPNYMTRYVQPTNQPTIQSCQITDQPPNYNEAFPQFLSKSAHNPGTAQAISSDNGSPPLPLFTDMVNAQPTQQRNNNTSNNEQTATNQMTAKQINKTHRTQIINMPPGMTIKDIIMQLNTNFNNNNPDATKILNSVIRDEQDRNRIYITYTDTRTQDMIRGKGFTINNNRGRNLVVPAEDSRIKACIPFVPHWMDVDDVASSLAHVGVVSDGKFASVNGVRVGGYQFAIQLHNETTLPERIQLGQTTHKITRDDAPKHCVYCKRVGHAVRTCQDRMRRDNERRVTDLTRQLELITKTRLAHEKSHQEQETEMQRLVTQRDNTTAPDHRLNEIIIIKQNKNIDMLLDVIHNADDKQATNAIKREITELQKHIKRYDIRHKTNEQHASKTQQQNNNQRHINAIQPTNIAQDTDTGRQNNIPQQNIKAHDPQTNDDTLMDQQNHYEQLIENQRNQIVKLREIQEIADRESRNEIEQLRQQLTDNRHSNNTLAITTSTDQTNIHTTDESLQVDTEHSGKRTMDAAMISPAEGGGKITKHPNLNSTPDIGLSMVDSSISNHIFQVDWLEKLQKEEVVAILESDSWKVNRDFQINNHELFDSPPGKPPRIGTSITIVCNRRELEQLRDKLVGSNDLPVPLPII